MQKHSKPIAKRTLIEDLQKSRLVRVKKKVDPRVKYLVISIGL